MLLFSSKAEELKNLIQNEHILWISQYLVMKRASIEPNFHQLYLEFMESLELSNFAREVLKETYRNIKVGSKEKSELNKSHVLLPRNLNFHLFMSVS